jgi:hypothetical protein
MSMNERDIFVPLKYNPSVAAARFLLVQQIY